MLFPHRLGLDWTDSCIGAACTGSPFTAKQPIWCTYRPFLEHVITPSVCRQQVVLAWWILMGFICVSTGILLVESFWHKLTKSQSEWRVQGLTNRKEFQELLTHPCLHKVVHGGVEKLVSCGARVAQNSRVNDPGNKA